MRDLNLYCEKLTKGKYELFVEIDWYNWKVAKNKFTVVCYGKSEVNFNKSRKTKIEILK